MTSSTDSTDQVEGEVKHEERDPEQEARRQLALAQIRQYPDPALRMAARPVEDFDDDLRRLADRMAQLMVDASGVGLAAKFFQHPRQYFLVERTIVHH